MEVGGPRLIRRLAFAVAIALLAAAALYALALLIGGASADTWNDSSVPLFCVALAAGSTAWAGWREERRATADYASREEAARREADEGRTAKAQARKEVETARAQLEDMREQLGRERERRTRVERAREVEHHWNRELREQIVNMHRERGLLGDTDDIRALVLHIAVTLLGAEKGLLLLRQDRDGDGDLDMVCYEGFENDPRHSLLAQRFASEVIESDEIVREDGHEAERENATPADREIENIVAIPVYVQDEFSGVVVCANKPDGFHDHDDQVLLALGDHAGAVLDNGRLQGDLRNAYLSTVRLLADAIQAKDPFLRGHSDEVSEYVSAVAERLGVEAKRREELLFGSLLHDVGKLGISERILLKPAALTPEERGVIELHPRIGYRLVQQVSALDPIAPAILHHHERWDGTGYPDRLAGEDIPLEARIICVADSFSAMTAERPYRRRMSLDEACQELERCSGSQFDPDVVTAFVEVVREHPRERDEHPLHAAMTDPEVERSRDGEEPVLGYGPLAVTDNLTLLYTHRYFHEVAQAEARRAEESGEPFAAVMVELTDVAHVNRLDGYAAGDEAIRAAARAVQRAAVRCAGTACRYSGRRVALIVPDADEETVERIRGDVAGDLAEGPRVVIGAALWHEGDSPFDVIARARLALSPVPLPPAV